jgi:hypothetical protein
MKQEIKIKKKFKLFNRIVLDEGAIIQYDLTQDHKLVIHYHNEDKGVKRNAFIPIDLKRYNKTLREAISEIKMLNE